MSLSGTRRTVTTSEAHVTWSFFALARAAAPAEVCVRFFLGTVRVWSPLGPRLGLLGMLEGTPPWVRASTPLSGGGRGQGTAATAAHKGSEWQRLEPQEPVPGRPARSGSRPRLCARKPLLTFHSSTLPVGGGPSLTGRRWMRVLSEDCHGLAERDTRCSSSGISNNEKTTGL